MVKFLTEEENGKSLAEFEKNAKIKNKWRWDWLKTKLVVAGKEFELGDFIKKSMFVILLYLV